MLDWVKEWNTGKTLINGNTVITPKLFAGTKNSDGTVSGIAIGSVYTQYEDLPGNDRRRGGKRHLWI